MEDRDTLTPIRISEAAKHMGYSRRHTLRRLLILQSRYRDIEILIPRNDPADQWRINPIGLKRADELERKKPEADLAHRVGMLEASEHLVQRKLQRLERRLSRVEDAEKSQKP
jgi:hypothetical protein